MKSEIDKYQNCERVDLMTINHTTIPEIVLIARVRTGQIPTVGVIDFDNRACCRPARRGETSPVGCPNLGRNSGGTTWCRLNGRARASACVFDEPESAPVWARIREQQAVERELAVSESGEVTRK